MSLFQVMPTAVKKAQLGNGEGMLFSERGGYWALLRKGQLNRDLQEVKEGVPGVRGKR